jgi:hypothetical protein
VGDGLAFVFVFVFVFVFWVSLDVRKWDKVEKEGIAETG